MTITGRLLLVGCLLLGFAFPLAAEPPPDTSYLKEMPAPARVVAEIRGADAIDTDARQWGAFRRLMTMMSLLSQGRDVANKMTPEETRLRLAYRDALPRFNAKSSRYEYDEALRQELFDRFFSPTWQAHYRALETRQGERQAEIARRDEAARQHHHHDAWWGRVLHRKHLAHDADDTLDVGAQHGVASLLAAERQRPTDLGALRQRPVSGEHRADREHDRQGHQHVDGLQSRHAPVRLLQERVAEPASVPPRMVTRILFFGTMFMSFATNRRRSELLLDEWREFARVSS